MNSFQVEFDRTQMIKLMFIIIGIACIAILPVEPTYAQDFAGVQNVLNKLTAAITGPIGISIASLAVVGVGFSFMMGHMDWQYAAAVVVGIAIVFGAVSLVNTFKGAAGGTP